MITNIIEPLPVNNAINCYVKKIIPHNVFLNKAGAKKMEIGGF